MIILYLNYVIYIYYGIREFYKFNIKIITVSQKKKKLVISQKKNQLTKN